MAGEDQYINPIIQAMIASSQLQGQAASRKQQAEQEKTQNAQRQQQIDQETERLKEEHEFHQQTIDNATQLLKAHLAQAHNETAFSRIQNFKTLSDLSKNGVDIGKLFPGTPQDSGVAEVGSSPTVSLPGNEGDQQNVPVSAFPTQQQSQQSQFALEKGSALAKTQGEQEALAPFSSVAFGRQKDLEHQKAIDAMNRTITEGANQERIANIHGGYSLAAEREATNGRLQGIKYAHQLGLGDEDSAIANNLEDSVINGTQPYNTLSPDQKRAVTGVAQAKGHVLPTVKGYTDALDTAKESQSLLQQARDLANNYSSDSGNTNYLMNAVKQHIPGTDLKAKMDSLNGQVNTVRTGLGVSRSSNPETERLFKAIFSPTNTKEQNMDNIESLAKQLNVSVNNLFPKNVPASQKNYVLGNRGITDFGGFSDKSTKAGKIGIKLDDGRIIPDTPENRQLNGLSLTAVPQ